MIRMKWYHGMAFFITGEMILALLFYATVWKHHNSHYRRDRRSHFMKRDSGIKLHEYYNITLGEESSGLDAVGDTFFLNYKSLKILSGSLHYFRVHPAYWRDRLKKLRAMGCNTVETYIPWNLHEPEKDVYDFGVEGAKTSYQFSGWLDVVSFIKMAQEEDLFVIVRPGPYICSEWEFGGLPSYLLSIPGLKVRTNDKLYLERVDKYFERLLPQLVPLRVEQGGPIIMFQIENEYGNLIDDGEKEHLEYLKMKMESLGINSFFVTSDGNLKDGTQGSLVERGVLITINFQDNTQKELEYLRTLQPFRPVMVMEFWTGWFDHWGEKHSTRSPHSYAEKLSYIINFPASVNLYMFHGGTNFGFMNGANQWDIEGGILYEPDTTSYDYDALLTENGEYTRKYFLTREIFLNEQRSYGIEVPDLPKTFVMPYSYPHIIASYQMVYSEIISSIPLEDRIKSNHLMPMELLPLKSRIGSGERGGQSYGYTLYRQTCFVDTNPEIKILGRVRDLAILLVNGKKYSGMINNLSESHKFGFWGAMDEKMRIFLPEGKYTFDFLVENMGRNNFGYTLHHFDQQKGLFKGSVTFSGKQPSGVWEIFTLDFQPNWIESLRGWTKYSLQAGDLESPTMFKFILEIEEHNIHDIFLDMRGWGKGVVFVNNFNIGRYFSIGPLMSLYIPAPLLVAGVNMIVVFEHDTQSGVLYFSEFPIYKQ